MGRQRNAERRAGRRPPSRRREGVSPESRARSGTASGRLRRKRALLVVAVLAIALVAVSAFLVVARPFDRSPQPKAAIVDQMSLSSPNPTFIASATSMLEKAGYAVDYYPGENVTVDFYRELPSQDYKLIIMRAHSAVPGENLIIRGEASAATVERVTAAIAKDTVLFTSEPYSKTKYLDEQVALRLFPVQYYGIAPGTSEYFAIGPEFIRSSMRGEFDETTVVLVGCSGLMFERTAAALVEKGAGAVVGWTNLVSADHTDAATERLLQHLLTEGLTPGEAVAKTMTEVGPDPSYGSVLRIYPPEAAALALP